VSNLGCSASKIESSAVLFESRKSDDESRIVREESCVRHFESSAAHEGFKIVLLGFKKSSDDFIANDSESSTVLLGSKKSSDDFKKSSRRSKKSDQRFKNSLLGVTFVRDESSASDRPLLAALFGFFVSG
jgi:hypothetical protein